MENSCFHLLAHMLCMIALNIITYTSWHAVVSVLTVLSFCCSDVHPGEWSDVLRFNGITAWLRYEAARWSSDQGQSAKICIERRMFTFVIFRTTVNLASELLRRNYNYVISDRQCFFHYRVKDCRRHIGSWVAKVYLFLCLRVRRNRRWWSSAVCPDIIQCDVTHPDLYCVLLYNLHHSGE